MSAARKRSAIEDGCRITMLRHLAETIISIRTVVAMPRFAKYGITRNDLFRFIKDSSRSIKSRRGAPLKVSLKQEALLKTALLSKNNGNGLSVFDVQMCFSFLTMLFI